MLDGRLQQISRHHRDLDAADSFYGEILGLTRIARFDPPGLVFFELGDTRLLVERGNPDSTVLYFRVDDIDATRAALAARGVEFEDEPHVIFADDAGQFGPAGQSEWMTFFRDPDGGVLALAARR